MLCDGCKKNEANMMLHMITNGQLATRSLCVDCARKAHGEMAQAFSTMGLRMEGLNGMVEQQAEQEPIRLPKMICSSCRTPYEDIDHQTVFGCSSCYQAFHQIVIDYLSSLQEQILPVNEEDTQEAAGLSERELLLERMQFAVQSEDYEQAARLRDELNRLDQESAARDEVEHG